MGSILRAQRAATLFFSCCFCGGRTRKSGSIHDLPDRSPGLARVHACAKEARGWGWALRLAEEKHLFVPRSWRRCDPTTGALLQAIVKDRAVGYSGMVSPLYIIFLLHFKRKRTFIGIMPNRAHANTHEHATSVIRISYKYLCN